MISIIIPTYNEKKNASELLLKIFKFAPKAEVVIIDDSSPDGTTQHLTDHMKNFRRKNIKILTRPLRKGAVSAVLEGVKLSTNNICCVIDADHVHAPEVIQKMHYLIEKEGFELVVGSRLINGSVTKDWPLHKRIFSSAAKWIVKPLGNITDVTSGIIVFKKEVLEGVKLQDGAVRFSLEILCKGNYKNVTEVPIEYRAGESKSNNLQKIGRYIVQLFGIYTHVLTKRLKNPDPKLPLLNTRLKRSKPEKPKLDKNLIS
jgi:dolichol-phosphate mannosyltransferase